MPNEVLCDTTAVGRAGLALLKLGRIAVCVKDKQPFVHRAFRFPGGCKNTSAFLRSDF